MLGFVLFGTRQEAGKGAQNKQAEQRKEKRGAGEEKAHRNLARRIANSAGQNRQQSRTQQRDNRSRMNHKTMKKVTRQEYVTGLQQAVWLGI